MSEIYVKNNTEHSVQDMIGYAFRLKLSHCRVLFANFLMFIVKGLLVA